ncbi:hypothetical protein P5_0035 [Aeromonas phage P5]|nr:hypothetical protein P5_0035 [Aeromonas phage P5]
MAKETAVVETATVEQFVAPVKQVPFTFHFKRVSEKKKPEEFKILVQAAEQFAHVGVTIEEVKNEATGEVTDRVLKRNSETYTLPVPDYEQLLSSVCLDEEGNLNVLGVTIKEFAALQRGAEAQVEQMGRALVDGTAAQDEEGSYILVDGKYQLEGFGVPSPEICSFALAAAIERRTGSGGAGKLTVPTDIRDAATASLCEYLATVGVPAQGIEMYGKLAKAYYSRNVTATLTPEAIKLTASRISNWFGQLDEDEQGTFSLFHQRLQDKAKEAAEPKVVELGIL